MREVAFNRLIFLPQRQQSISRRKPSDALGGNRYLAKIFKAMPDSKCPKCQSIYVYPTGTSMMCPECGYEWNPEESIDKEESLSLEADSSVVKDANGTVLQDGDTVVTIKDLPVKGSSKPIKAGTKVKNIKLTSGDHNIDCKVEGFGAMALKSVFVRKA